MADLHHMMREQVKRVPLAPSHTVATANLIALCWRDERDASSI